MPTNEPDIIDTHTFAAMKGKGYSTVMAWLVAGLVPGAYQEETPRGPVWKIPRKAAEAFTPPKKGRPKKAGAQ